jgi:hypothetical protein
MGSMTAHVAIGSEDLYHGGLGPSHSMWLWENGRPAWLLHPAIPSPDLGDGRPEPMRLVPSRPEHILADGLLFAAVRAGQEEQLLLLAASLGLLALIEDDFIDLSKHDLDLLERLRDELRQRGLRQKLVISVFGGSSLESQLPVLDDYPVDVEVCTVTYSRLSGGWRSGTEVRGSLRASWGPQGPTPDRYREVSFPTDVPAALADEDNEDEHE